MLSYDMSPSTQFFAHVKVHANQLPLYDIIIALDIIYNLTVMLKRCYNLR